MKAFWKKWSLGGKFVFWASLLLISIFTLAAIILLNQNIKITRDNLTSSIRGFSKLATRPIVENYNLYYNSGYFKFKEIFQNILALNTNIKQVQIIRTNGVILFDSRNLDTYFQNNGEEKVSDEVLKIVQKPDQTEILNPKNSDEILEIISPYFDDWGSHYVSVRYFVSYDQVKKNAAKVEWLIILLSGVFLVITAGIIHWVVFQLILSPLAKVNFGTQQIKQGNYDYQIAVETGDEIEDLARAANEMAKTLRADILELKKLYYQAERAKNLAIQEKNRNVALLDSISDGVIAVDERMRVLLFNIKAEAITGWTVPEANRRVYDQFLSLPRKLVETCFKTGTNVNIDEFVSKRKDGRKINLSANLAPVILKKQTIGVIISFREIIKKWGNVLDIKTGKPIHLAMVRIFDVAFNRLKETKLTDEQGRYGFLVNKGEYYLTVNKNGYKELKTSPIKITKKEQAFIGQDLFLEPLESEVLKN